MPNGKLITLDLASVKSTAGKVSTYVRAAILKKEGTLRDKTVIFLGESHTNPVDTGSNTDLTTVLPMVVDGATRIIFERGLDNNYAAAASIKATQSTENSPMGTSNRERSTRMANMAHSAFSDHDAKLVYIVCGSKHAPEVFNDLEKLSDYNFSYVVKPSVTD